MEYVGWEEVSVSSDKGKREVHYYLKRIDGDLDLAVIAKEKSLRHMSYYYAIKSRSLFLSLKPPLKLKSRREVIDWLSSIVSESAVHESSFLTGSLNNSCELDFAAFKDIQSRKLSGHMKELLWLGSPWTCRKRRKHYQSFRRNGVIISVHDFVFVLAEEDKRLVAYLEDMYEDSKGNKMVVVRWFHKIDEVGIVLPRNFNDREIFFSLCLQDLSIECIDGLATVLSPQHFEKFLKEATHTKLNPFVCHKQFENDDIKPLDITLVKGYWKQEILRYMYTIHQSKDLAKPYMSDDSMRVEGCFDDSSGIRPNKRHRPSKDNDMCAASKESADSTRVGMVNLQNSWVDCKSGAEMGSLRGECAAFLSTTETNQNSSQHLKVGSEVEVLSQDSGIRGCWFRASIIKKHKDKVKIRYQDIKDADDEAKNLEEWILASKVAVPDQLGIRVSGRTIVRPSLQYNRDRFPLVVDVGTAVDAWWHDAWWEGIVVRKDSQDRVLVYFPGEQQQSVFCCADLRHSQEWLGNKWKHIEDRPNIVSSVLPHFAVIQVTIQSDENKLHLDVPVDNQQFGKSEVGVCDSSLENENYKAKELGVTSDLSKDNSLAHLRWKTSKKRRRSGKSSPDVSGTNAFERFLIPTTLNVDRENCKYIGDSLFSSGVVQPLTSLVMSR